MSSWLPWSKDLSRKVYADEAVCKLVPQMSYRDSYHGTGKILRGMKTNDISSRVWFVILLNESAATTSDLVVVPIVRGGGVPPDSQQDMLRLSKIAQRI